MQVIYVLWLRQIRRFSRIPSRIFGVIGQPLLFLVALGYGLGSVFQRAGEGDYLQFLVPGIITQTILFSGFFWGINILFDKRFGFLMELLVAPVSRVKILLGSALGGATVSLLQGIIVLVIATALGFRPHNWLMIPTALLIMVALSLALTSFGAGVASMLEDFQGFQSVSNFIIFPMFFLSSALYPLTHAPAILTIFASINPISYGVDALRWALINQSHFGIGVDVLALSITLVISVAFAVNRFNRIQT